MGLQTKKVHDVVILSASAAKTVTGNAEGHLPGMVNAFVFTLDVTAAATDNGDTLNVKIQTKADGTNWIDVAHFTEVVGDGGAKRFGMKISAAVAQAIFTATVALTAGNAVRNVLGDEWRVVWTIVDVGGDDASFTFSVTACPM